MPTAGRTAQGLQPAGLVMFPSHKRRLRVSAVAARTASNLQAAVLVFEHRRRRRTWSPGLFLLRFQPRKRDSMSPLAACAYRLAPRHPSRTVFPKDHDDPDLACHSECC